MTKIKYLFCWLICLIVGPLWAHGTIEIPASRVLNCYRENPENPLSAACKAAVVAGGVQAFYDWNGVNQAAANDRHADIIPDGKLCSANKDEFKGLDLPRTDWVSTTIMPDSSGRFTFTFNATAPHATKYFKLYVTKPTYNFAQPLKWSDLESLPFCTVTQVTLNNGRYALSCPFPSGSGKRMIYAIWQRSDSMEAFYSCVDVVLASSSTPGPGPVPTPVTWNELGNLIARADVNSGVKILFRLMQNGVDVETYSILAASGQNTTAAWPYYLAQAVNKASSAVKIGVLDSVSKTIVPVQNASLNKVYIKDSNTSVYRFVVEFIAPSEDFNYVYPDGVASYTTGTIVMGFDKKRYQCKPWPYSAWCGQSPVYYEPGKGLAWQEAWTLLN